MHQIVVNFPCYYTSAALIYSVWIKVTYINLGNDNPHEGWLIDHLYFDIEQCEWLYADTDIQEKTSYNNIIIYPNPTQDYFSISSPQTDNNAYQVVLYNTEGQKVLHTTVLNANEPIDVSHLPKGMYVCAIKHNGLSNKR